MTDFVPTHRITTHRITTATETVDVMLVDGAAYTQAEWDSSSAADYERSANGLWTFQGRAFDGTIAKLDGDAMNAETLTRTQIEALQTEAGRAADHAMVDICERALDGCPIALEACRKAIDDAAAMDDETLAQMTNPYFLASVREDGSWDVIREIAAKDDDEANAIAERECEGDDWYVLTRRGGRLVNINGGVDG